MNSVDTAVGRGPRAARLGAVLVLTVSLAISGCEWVFYEVTATVLHRATIRVDGRDYTSEAVYQSYRERIGGRGGTSAWGRVLAFRLQDDRVVVLPLHKTVSWACAPRLDGKPTGCKVRWQAGDIRSRRPDGYVFNNAIEPTSVEVFQFYPSNTDFDSLGKYRHVPATPPVPISESRVELVEYHRQDLSWSGSRDSLDRDFPGFGKIFEAPHNAQVRSLLNVVPIPSRRSR